MANRDGEPTRRRRQDQGAITSHKVVAQGDQVTRLNKQPGTDRLNQAQTTSADVGLLLVKIAINSS